MKEYMNIVKKYLRVPFFLLFISLLSFFNNTYAKYKIVGLVAARNEKIMITQCLRSLATVTDAIVFLDDCSEDNTVEIVESLAQECHVEKIIRKISWYRDEAGDKNLLLNAGREIGGTHFIILDADEMFTANCRERNRLRRIILSLMPGDGLCVHWYNLWRDPYHYRSDNCLWTTIWGDCIFCDDGKASYTKEFLHTPRTPENLVGNRYQLPKKMGILHFQFVNWRNLLIKQAWYRCLERIRLPAKRSADINERYAPSKDERKIQVSAILPEWYDGYYFFDDTIFEQLEQWREKQILQWFEEHGKDYFADLDIWDIDWGKASL